MFLVEAGTIARQEHHLLVIMVMPPEPGVLPTSVSVPQAAAADTHGVCSGTWLCHSHCKGLWENYLITSNLTSTSSLYTAGNHKQDQSQSVFHKDQKDWYIWFCYRLNVCAPTKFMLNPNPNVMTLGGGAFGRGLDRHEWN